MKQPEMSWQWLKCDWDVCQSSSILQRLVELVGFVGLVALQEAAVEKSSMHYSSGLDP